MQNIINLYSSILVLIFSEWINEWELCRLDCAVTQRKVRDHFLTLLSQSNVSNVKMRNECLYSKFEWIILRKLSVRNIASDLQMQSKQRVRVLSHLRFLDSISDDECEDAVTAIEKNPNLTYVKVRYDGTPSRIPSKVGNLKHIKLQCKSDITTPMFEWNNPSLMSFSVFNHGLSDTYVIDLVRHCPALTCLEVSGSITDDGLREVAMCCPSLKTLRIGTEITNNGLVFMAMKCSRLTSLSIKKCHLITDIGVGAVLGLSTNLASLDVQGCHEKAYRGLANALSVRPSLTSISAANLKHLIPSFPSVQYLGLLSYAIEMSPLLIFPHIIRFSSTTSVSNHYLSILKRCPDLLELVIDGISLSNYNSLLEKILRRCPQLTALHCRGLADDDANDIVTSGIQLKILALTFPVSYDATLVRLIQSQRHLSHIALKPNFYRCTDRTLHAIAQHCPNLCSIELENKEFSEQGVVKLLRKCATVRSLVLNGCSSVTVAVLDTIAELNRDMTLVDVSRCNISKEESEEFLRKIEGKINIVCLLNSQEVDEDKDVDLEYYELL